MRTPHPPRSPFSTPLSGSAQETELRLRNIFQWKKGRPPMWLLGLALAVCLLCGSLVSCQSQPSIVQDDSLTQLLLEHTTLPDAPEGTPVTVQLLAQITQDGYTLGAAAVQQGNHYLLVLGAVDSHTLTPCGTFYQAVSNLPPHCIAITRYDGSPFLLYTCNGFSQGLSYGEAGLVALNGDSMVWGWPVEGDLRGEGSSSKAEYDAYWQSHHALLAPGGVDIFTQTDYAIITGDGPQWTPESNELFYPAAEDELPIGVMYQSRVWLEKFTRDKNNPLDAVNTSALWSIQSLTPDDFQYLNQADSQSAYTLLARADTDDGLYFAAHILFDQETGTISTAYDYAVGSLEEVTEQVLSDQAREEARSQFQQRGALILTYYQQPYPSQRFYWLDQEPSQPQEGDTRLDSVAYAGEAILYETTGVAFSVQRSLYSHGQWSPYPEPALIVLSQGQDGSFQSVLGEPNFSTDGMAIEDVIRQVNWHLLDLEVCLYRDGYPNPIGPGNWYDLFRPAYEGEPDLQILEGYTPIYYPGDHWESWSVEGFSALRYYQAAADRYTLNSVDVTRDDLYTPRGIRVGATRAEVLAAYPEAVSRDYWGLYPEQDYLWYSKYSNDFGAAILFFFQGDTLTQITLNDMFD